MLSSQFHRQAGLRSYRDDSANSRHDRLLHQFETGAPTEHEHGIGQRQTSLQKRRADQFVYGVVTSDVFA
jgi:hypothetical protein